MRLRGGIVAAASPGVQPLGGHVGAPHKLAHNMRAAEAD